MTCVHFCFVLFGVQFVGCVVACLCSCVRVCVCVCVGVAVFGRDRSAARSLISALLVVRCASFDVLRRVAESVVCLPVHWISILCFFLC